MAKYNVNKYTAFIYINILQKYNDIAKVPREKRRTFKVID